MGLLDDAIREHLDLKRRRGADPSELARQEHEALGPARRLDDDEAVAVETPPAVAPAETDEPERAGALSMDRVTDDDVEWSDPPRPAPEAAAVQEEHREDVLEETPEFLEDAPEHDRLWFEQRPPRDFDFDR
jgi:hypothetical protein